MPWRSTRAGDSFASKPNTSKVVANNFRLRGFHSSPANTMLKRPSSVKETGSATSVLDVSTGVAGNRFASLKSGHRCHCFGGERIVFLRTRARAKAHCGWGGTGGQRVDGNHGTMDPNCERGVGRRHARELVFPGRTSGGESERAAGGSLRHRDCHCGRASGARRALARLPARRSARSHHPKAYPPLLTAYAARAGWKRGRRSWISGRAASAAASPASISRAPWLKPSHSMAPTSGAITRSVSLRQLASARLCRI